MDSKDKEHIQYLMEKYDFKERYKNLLIQIQDVLEGLGILEKVTINADLLGQAVLNYFEDVDRLKEFEGINRTNEDKIYGYETFWLLRDKPIQIMDSDMPYEYLYINEKVFTWILVAKMLREAGIDPDDENQKLMSFLKLIYYNFKFRSFNQQSLELMITAFFCGCKFDVRTETLGCVKFDGWCMRYDGYVDEDALRYRSSS